MYFLHGSGLEFLEGNMRYLALASVLALAACGAPEAPEEAAETNASTETTETTTDDAEAAETDSSEDADAESAEEAAITEELKNSVASDKADGDSKPVECTVASAPGGVEYKGQCEYFILGGDSFTMVRTDGLEFFEGIMEVIIQADTPTQANLSVRTSDGERPNYGTAYREAGESCWINDSLDVCWTDL